MKLNTCPNHPGRVIETHPCPLCGHPAVPPEDRQPFRAHPLAKSRPKEEPVSVSADTVKSNAEVRLKVDTRTGELVQPTLDDAIFPAVSRRDVPTLKVSFSGTVELAQSDWEAYCRQGLEPGRLVTVSLTGYLPNPHAAWVKRTESDPMTREKHVWWEREGRITIKALELGSLDLGDVYDGD